jgi:uncharacterized protein YxjI
VFLKNLNFLKHIITSSISTSVFCKMIDIVAPIAPQFRANQPTEMFLNENKLSFTGDSATVKSKDGNVLFKLEANLLSFTERRMLLDSNGNVVGQMRKKRLPSIKSKVYLGTAYDEKMVSVVKKGLLDIMHDDADIMMGGKVIGEVKGNWRAKKFDIFINDNLVAHINRKTTVASLALGADSYCLRVEPGVDQAFIVLVAIALDELYHDE